MSQDTADPRTQTIRGVRALPKRERGVVPDARWGALLLNSLPGLARQFKPIPAAYFATYSEDERIISCPCHRRPVLALGELKSCEGARQWVPSHAALGPCPRVFIATNRGVLVTGGPKV